MMMIRSVVVSMLPPVAQTRPEQDPRSLPLLWLTHFSVSNPFVERVIGSIRRECLGPPLAGALLPPDLVWRLRKRLSACLAPLAHPAFHGGRGTALTALPHASVPEDLDGFSREHALEQTKPLGRTATDDDQGGHRGRPP